MADCERAALLNGEIFYSLNEAKVISESWRRHYNTIRPHSSLAYQPPSPETLVWLAAQPGPATPTTPALAPRPQANHEDAAQTLTEFRETKSTLWISYFLTTLARSFFQKGMLDQARSFVDQATIVVSNSGQNWFLPEIQSISAELAANRDGDLVASYAYYEEAKGGYWAGPSLRQQRRRSEGPRDYIACSRFI